MIKDKIIVEVINADFLESKNNLKPIQIRKGGIIERISGIKISETETSLILNWYINKIGKREKRNGWKILLNINFKNRDTN